jgi:cyanophycin synthetase
LGTLPPLAAHLDAGGRVVCVETEAGVPWIVLYADGSRLSLSPVNDLPATWQGRARHNVQNAMFAAAMAHALGRTPAEIGAALRTFRSDPADNHGRLNRYRGAPFEFLVDYCHNRHGIEAIGAMASAMAVQGRRLLAFALAGNHRDEDFESAGREAARHFDALVAYAPPERYLRGRTAAEIAGRIAAAFRGARGDASAAWAAEDAAAAARLLFDAAGPGDLVIATGANQQPFIEELRRRWPSLAPA